MLEVAGIGADQPPRTLQRHAKGPSPHKTRRIGSAKERQGIQGTRTVEEEDQPMPLDCWVATLVRERRYRYAGGYVHTSAIGAIAPVVVRTLDGVADHTAVAQIRMQMAAISIEHHDRPAFRAK